VNSKESGGARCHRRQTGLFPVYERDVPRTCILAARRGSATESGHHTWTTNLTIMSKPSKSNLKPQAKVMVEVDTASMTSKSSAGRAKKLKTKPRSKPRKSKDRSTSKPRKAKKESMQMPESGDFYAPSSSFQGQMVTPNASAYLWGLMDPQHAARGPGDGNYPTVVIQHESFTDLSLSLSDSEYNSKSGINYGLYANITTSNPTGVGPYINGVPDPTGAFTTSHKLALPKGVDSATIVCMPHMVRSINGDTQREVNVGSAVPGSVADTFRSGFVVAGPAEYATGMYTNTLGANVAGQKTFDGVMMVPLSGFDGVEPFRVPVTMAAVQAGNTWSVGGAACVRHRTVGLKMEVVINSNAFRTSGQVVGGNNAQIFGVEPEQLTDMAYYNTVNAVGALDPVPSDNVVEMLTSEPYNPEQVIFGDGATMSNSRRDLGALLPGVTYESTFVPTNDHITRWATTRARYSACNMVQASGPYNANDFKFQARPDLSKTFINTIGNHFNNTPAVYITLSGIPPNNMDSAAGITCRVRMTWAVEYTVLNGGPLALLRGQARLNKRFMVDWGVLSRCCTAGRKHECCARALACCKPLQVGLLMATGTVPPPPMNEIPMNMKTIGVASFTEEIEDAAGVEHGGRDGRKMGAQGWKEFREGASRIAKKISSVSRAIGGIATRGSGLPGVAGIASMGVAGVTNAVSALIDSIVD